MADEGDPGSATKHSALDGKEAVRDIPVKVTTVLGTAGIQVRNMLKLGRGTVVDLDRRVGDSIDIYVNKQLVARGQLMQSEDGRLAVTMTEILKSKLTEV